MSEKKIFCPCCGKHEQVQPVWYQVDKDVTLSIPDDMDPQYAADSISSQVDPDDGDITINNVTCSSTVVIPDGVRMVWCPHCGHQHAPLPVQYKLEDEYETFQDHLKDYKTTGEGEETKVTIETCHIEAGPWNGDRYLMDYDHNMHSCPKCNKTFTME